jgi:hypothetical protein
VGTLSGIVLGHKLGGLNSNDNPQLLYKAHPYYAVLSFSIRNSALQESESKMGMDPANLFDQMN